MILFSVGPFSVRAERYGKIHGFAVYEDGATAGRRVAQIGIAGDAGLRRAISEALLRDVVYCQQNSEHGK